MKNVVLIVLFALAVPFAGHSWTNDLIILAIRRTNDCTTLTWKSHAGEFYNVYWTSNSIENPFWRMAAVHIPSQGTNTTWSECEPGEGMMMMAPPGGEGDKATATTYEEALEWYEANRPAREASVRYLEDLLREAVARSGGTLNGLNPGGGEMQSSAPPPPGGGGTPSTNQYVSTYKFYRVARVAVTGFVDGWGHQFGPIPSDTTNAIAISAGPYDSGVHNLALLSNGTVRAWGNNAFGQCNVPGGLSNVIAVSAGGRHSIAVKRNGSVLIWGDNTFGQITNVPTNLIHVIDVKAGLWHNLVLTSNGTVAAWGDLFNRTNAVPAGLSNVTAIAAGPRHCLALKADRTVVAWGFDHSFLGNFLPTNVPSTLTNVVAIAAGMEHNQAVLRDGTTVVWGRTDNFAISRLPAGLTNLLGASAGWHSGLAWDDAAAMQSWGLITAPAGLSSVVAGSAGYLHGLALRTNNLGPVIRRQPADTAATNGSVTNISVLATSELPLSYQWQKNGLDLTGQTSAVLSFPNLQDTNDGYYRVRVSTSTAELWSRQALVQTIHKPVITNQSPLNVRVPEESAFVLSVEVISKGSTKVVYRWYRNGQFLPLPFTTNFGRPIAVLGDEGSYWVVVSNEAGSTTSQVWQVSITLSGETTVWGDASDHNSAITKLETNLIRISAGGVHSLALREDTTVLAWGDNFYGATNVPSGLSNVVSVAAGQGHSLALKDDGTVVGWGLNNFGQSQPPANITNIAAIAAGACHSVALTKPGVVLGWGDNSAGALNIPTNLIHVVQIAAGNGLSYARLSNGTVRAWGSGGLGAVMIPSNLSNVVEIAAGHTHLLALNANGTVTGLGPDSGWGETTPPASLSNVLHIAGGSAFSLALLNDGSIRAWGRSEHGETNVPSGLGDTKAISAGAFHALALAYSPTLLYPIDVTRDLLLLYNTNSQNSITVKDYYLANRPGVSRANTLGLTCPSADAIAHSQFTNDIQQPVLNWLSANPTKRPEYIVLFLDVPNYAATASVSHRLRLSISARKPYITHINMGASGTNDCIGYIDKLKIMGSTFSPGKIYIRPSAGGYANTNYYFDDAHRIHRGLDPSLPDLPHARDRRDAVLAFGVPPTAITYANGTNMTGPEEHILSATNVAGYFAWGWNGCMGSDYAIGPAPAGQECHFNWTFPGVAFHGDSSWYILHTHESHCGLRFSYQGNFVDWFSSNAFGGTSYWNTPAGAVSSVAETLQSSNNKQYFVLWATGRSFAMAAWLSQPSVALQAIGDPFIVR